MYILLFIINLILVVYTFPFAKIEPDKQFQDKRNSLIIKCNTTSFSKQSFLLYTFNGNNFTIPRVINNDTYVYYGNLSVTDPGQFRVNVMCLEKDSLNLLGSKIYFFGYPPHVVLIGDSMPKLTCRDFNLKWVLCYMSPSENEIAHLTGLVEEINGHLDIKLTNTQSGQVERKLNNSCFNVSEAAFTTSLSFTLSISNDLGSQQYNFSYNRYDLLKPETPKLFLSEINRNLQLKIDTIHDGEFLINITCFSTSPVKITKKLNEKITKRYTTNQFTGWLPYSLVYCEIQSRILLGPTGMGHFSEMSVVEHRMLESEPNIGPITSPAFMTYDSLLDDDLLMKIVLYFLDLELIDQNGDIVKYMWNCDNCFRSSGVRLNGNVFIDKHSRSITISKAKINSSVSITACTAVGCSKKWSKINLTKLSDAELKERIYLIHDTNSNNINNWYLSWYLNNKLFVEMSPSSDIPNTRETQPSVLLCYKIQNETLNPENKCSSTELIPLNQFYGKKYLSINNRIPVQFAFIQSFNNSPSSKLAWFTCLYEKSKDYETALLMVKHDRYVSSKINCSFSTCKVSLKIKIPPCSKINTVIFDGIKVEYETYTGYKNVSQYFVDRNEMFIVISELNSNKQYDLKIFVITEDNDIFWGTYKLNTGWYATYKVVLIVVVVILAISMSIFGMIKCYQWQTNHMFKKKFKSTSQRIVKNCSVKKLLNQPLTLNNASDNSQFPQIGGNNFPSSVFNSSFHANHQYTDLTTVESTTDTSDSNYSVAYTGEDTNESPPNSDNSYITRPEQNKVPELLYMTLVEVDSKKISETMNSEFLPHISA